MSREQGRTSGLNEFFILIGFMLIIVHGQKENVVSPFEVDNGGVFTVNCDASRVELPVDPLFITEVSIGRLPAGSKEYTEIASYKSDSTDNGNSSKAIPAGREWDILFSGTDSSMKIAWMVLDANPSDEGAYECIVYYMLENSNVIHTESRLQSISIRTALYQLVDIVSVDEVVIGNTFAVICDANRVEFVEHGVTDFVTAGLYRFTKSSMASSLVAQYKPFGSQDKIMNIPEGRKWEVKFSGAKDGVDNRDTMRIQMLIRDAEFDDSGSYECRIRYTKPSDGTDLDTSREQTISVVESKNGTYPTGSGSSKVRATDAAVFMAVAAMMLKIVVYV